MSGTFSALNTASLALHAQQRAIDVTGQNIANVNTEGYSRQRVDMQSIGGSTVPAFWSLSSQVGQGVDADQVTRIRDAFLEARAQTEHATTASLTVQNDTLSQIEQSFQEPGDTGIQSMLTNVWSGWSDIHNNPTDPGARSQLLARTQTLVAGLHAVAGALDGQWTNTQDSLNKLMTDVNASAAQVADLNQAIKRATESNMPTNELQDKRDVLVLHLADVVGATSAKQSDGTLSVSVGGTTLVSGNSPLQIKLAGPTSSGFATATPPGAPPVIVTDPGGTPLLVGGTAQGQLNALTSMIPRYQGKLDAIAQQLATQTNTAHAAGYDLYGNAGKPMFGPSPSTATSVTAANITLLISDPSQLAAASVSPTLAGGVTSADGGNADALFQQRLTTTGVDATYRAMIVASGVETATAAGHLATQSVVSSNVDSARESVAGVSTDEEMTNMLQFQHGYQAAGKLVETINSMLDDLMAMVR